MMEEKLDKVMELLDEINTIVEGTPKPPFPELYALSWQALFICTDIKRAAEGEGEK